MKKILHISTFYPPNKGGVEQTAYDIVSGLRDSYEQKVICFSHDKKNKSDTFDGVEVYRIGYFAKFASQAISFGYFRVLSSLLKSFNPDIVYLHLPNPLITIYLLMLKKRVKKLILHWHSDIVRQRLIKPFYKPLQKKTLRLADLIFATSTEYLEGSEDLKPFKNKVRILPSVVNEKKFVLTDENQKKIEKIKSRFHDKKIALFVGRHVKYKGIEYIIKASELISDQAVILIAGEGPLTPKLKKMAQGKRNIFFIGKLSDEELKEYLYSAYIFLFPSITRNEAFGLALAEALYCGIPAVGFKIEGSGVNFVNKDGYTGFMVENGNYIEFANKINLLLENESLRDSMSKNAKRWARENFNYGKIIENLKIELSGLINY